MPVRPLTISSIIFPEHFRFVNNHQKWTSTLIWSTLVVTFSTSFVMGVNIGGPNVYNAFIVPWTRGYPFPCQKDAGVAQWVAGVWWNCNYDNVSHMNKTGYYYLPEVPTNREPIQRLIDAMHTICFVLGGTIGGFTGQYWYIFLTRRNAIFVSMIFQVVASILMIITLEIYYGYTDGDPDLLTIVRTLRNKNVAVALLYISRLLSGWSAGMCCVVSTIYLTDISPRPMRGKIVTFHQLFIVIGLLVGQIVGLPWLLGRHKRVLILIIFLNEILPLNVFSTWNWGMSWIGLFSLAGCVLIWTLPESPRWLVQDHQRDAAARSLRTLRQNNLIEAELDEIERQEATAAMQDKSIYCMCFSPRFRWPLLTSITLNAVQQFSGINSVFFYSSTTFSEIGFVEDKVYWGILSTGIINLIATIGALKLVESFGRRSLILYPLVMIIFVMILLCVFIEMHKPIVALSLTLVFIVLFAIGLGPIPYIYPNEVFTIDMRPAALSISMFASWLCNTLITLFFQTLRTVFQGFVFLFFCVFCSLALWLLWFKMPETKRKTLTEIEAFWQ
ncbi:unnamed protein product [Rotaria socialis]|uniref:Major facilitator superfamily (MFS) profile domain-containing protein n=1 Tax=Rotaria socialis TaxID=392032 RepID=A0A818F3M3_9BILA|nr:unnamed protein product [Rotaria socialis]CAF3469029.1 unnamed protein product [Rotaria socialis]